MRSAVALLLAACALPPPPTRGFSWPTETFFRARNRDFAGFNTSRLAVDGGAPVPWTQGMLAAQPALVVTPAYFEGSASAYVITEIWENHPDVWVEPVHQFVDSYDPRDPEAARRFDLDGVFGVGTDSTFYSPFWRLYLTELAGAAEPITDIRQVARLTAHRAAMVVCPIVPDGVALSGSTHPFTGAPLQQTGAGFAWANGVRVKYLDLGKNRQAVEGPVDGVVRPVDMYFFAIAAADGGRELLDVPAVLPANAGEHAYVRRVDVVLTSEAVFAPASRPDLRERLEGKVSLPPTDPLIPPAVEREYLLRVARDGACFGTAATFPAGCDWLDSEAAVLREVPESRRFDNPVTLTATPVLLP